MPGQDTIPQCVPMGKAEGKMPGGGEVVTMLSLILCLGLVLLTATNKGKRQKSAWPFTRIQKNEAEKE